MTLVAMFGRAILTSVVLPINNKAKEVDRTIFSGQANRLV